MAKSRESPETEAGRQWTLAGPGRTADSSVPQLLVHLVGVIMTTPPLLGLCKVEEPVCATCVNQFLATISFIQTASFLNGIVLTGIVLLFKHSQVPRK